MLQPIGSLPPRVYWRRRLVVVAAVLILMISGWALFGGNGGKGGATAETVRSRAANGPIPSGGVPAATGAPTAGATPVAGARSAGTKTTPAKGTGKTAKQQCAANDLMVQAQPGKRSYPVNSTPTLYLQVTNVGTKPCRQDLADKQIQLQVTSGGIRVWGSHDCSIQPGVDVVTLVPNQPVKRGVVWSGQTSAPGCAGTRLIAQAGSYDLTSTLHRQTSIPVAFRLTGAG